MARRIESVKMVAHHWGTAILKTGSYTYAACKFWPTETCLTQVEFDHPVSDKILIYEGE